jgi:hypothetical protein
MNKNFFVILFIVVIIIVGVFLFSNIVTADVITPGTKSIGEYITINNIADFNNEYIILYSKISTVGGINCNCDIIKGSKNIVLKSQFSPILNIYAVEKGNYTDEDILNYFYVYTLKSILNSFELSNKMTAENKTEIPNLLIKYQDLNNENIVLPLIELRTEDYSEFKNNGYSGSTSFDPFENIVHSSYLKKDSSGNLILKEKVYRPLSKDFWTYIYFLIGLLFTFFIEGLLLSKFFKKSNFANFSWGKVFLFNLITYPIAMYFLPLVGLLIVELFVFILESILIKLLFKIPWKKSILYSFVINLITTILGLFLSFIFIPIISLIL